MVTLQKFIVLLTRKEFMTDATNKTKTKKENKNTRKIDKGSDLYPGVAKSEYIVFFVII